jgi:uncharacterized glyoxalase superfamily protein PhnB
MADPTFLSLGPYLFYDDVKEAVRFLEAAFGFTPVIQEPGPTGDLIHAQLSLGTDRIMLGKAEAGLCRFSSPRALDGLHAGVYVYVKDVDAHCERARAAGAKILLEPADMHWGDRMYSAQDQEGQFWMFASRISKSQV